MSTLAMTSSLSGRKRAPLTYFLAFVFTLFIGILIVCYAITRRTNPVFLDEHGKAVNSASGYGHGKH